MIFIINDNNIIIVIINLIADSSSQTQAIIIAIIIMKNNIMIFIIYQYHRGVLIRYPEQAIIMVKDLPKITNRRNHNDFLPCQENI